LISSAISNRQKIGPSMKRKLRAPSLAGFQHLGAENVRRHQVGRELDAVRAEPHDGRQRVDQKRLAQPRQTHQKRVPPRQHRREAERHDLLLPDDAGGDGRPRLGEPAAQRFDLGHEGLGILRSGVSGMAWLRIVLIWYQVTDLFRRPQIAKGRLAKKRDTSS
jgi:hypothetical protein